MKHLAAQFCNELIKKVKWTNRNTQQFLLGAPVLVKSHQYKQRWPTSTEVHKHSSRQQCWHTSSCIFFPFCVSDCMWQRQQLLRNKTRVIYFYYVLMSFGILKPRESAPFDQKVLPRPQARTPWTSLRTFVVDIIDCTVPFTLRMKPVTFITVTAILCQLMHFIFLTDIYLCELQPTLEQ